MALCSIRDRNSNYGSAAVSPCNRKASPAHHLKPLADVFQRNMGLTVIGGRKSPAVVGDYDFTSGSGFPRPD